MLNNMISEPMFLFTKDNSYVTFTIEFHIVQVIPLFSASISKSKLKKTLKGKVKVIYTVGIISILTNIFSHLRHDNRTLGKMSEANYTFKVNHNLCQIILSKEQNSCLQANNIIWLFLFPISTYPHPSFQGIFIFRLDLYHNLQLPFFKEKKRTICCFCTFNVLAYRQLFHFILRFRNNPQYLDFMCS